MTTVSRRPIESTLIILPQDTSAAVIAIPHDANRARICAFLVEPDKASLLDIDGVEHPIPSISLVDAHFAASLPLLICEVPEGQGQELEYGIRAHVRDHTTDPATWRTEVVNAPLDDEPEATIPGMRP